VEGEVRLGSVVRGSAASLSKAARQVGSFALVFGLMLVGHQDGRVHLLMKLSNVGDMGSHMFAYLC
jgi:hypothetical protein